MNRQTYSNMDIDELYMQRCIALAAKGRGTVAPNPMVGAVLVHNGNIIGEGWHRIYGQAHAEVNGINAVAAQQKENISRSTLYVSLEPCVHYGKTPPCTDLIIEQKIPKVVIGAIDTYSKVAGKGIKKLRDAGIEVVTGVLEKECRYLNRRFFSFHEKNRPYVVLKWAQSADGYIAPLNLSRKMLSNDYTRMLVHKMRSEEAAILTGYNTALADDPELTTRFWPGQSPVRVIPDFELDLPSTLKVFNQQQRTIIINFHKNDRSGNITWSKIDRNNIATEILDLLHREKLNSVLVEGGSKTLRLFIEAGLWDEAVITDTPVMLQTGIGAPLLQYAALQQQFYLESDRVRKFTRKTATINDACL